MTSRHRIIDTPTGPFAIIEFEDGSIHTGWVNGGVELRGEQEPHLLPDLAAKLVAYFEGEAVSFEDVPLPNGTEFLRRCWNACRSVPRGRTISYGELARRAGASPAAARAAGQAMRRNPQPIITPCHRVVGSTGDLHGFAGTTSGSSEALAIKRLLLELESRAAPQAAGV